MVVLAENFLFRPVSRGRELTKLRMFIEIRLPQVYHILTPCSSVTHQGSQPEIREHLRQDPRHLPATLHHRMLWGMERYILHENKLLVYTTLPCSLPGRHSSFI